MEVPQSGKPPFVIPELLQRFRDFLFGVPGGLKATGEGGISTTTSLAYIEAILVVRNESGTTSSSRTNHKHYRYLPLPLPHPD